MKKLIIIFLISVYIISCKKEEIVDCNCGKLTSSTLINNEHYILYIKNNCTNDIGDITLPKETYEMLIALPDNDSLFCFTNDAPW